MYKTSKLVDLRYELLEYPPYSTDLALLDHHIFSNSLKIPHSSIEYIFLELSEILLQDYVEIIGKMFH